MAYLGIDAGASATKWVLIHDGNIVAEGEQPAMDAHLYRPESAARLREVVRFISDETAIHRVDSIFMGITGYSKETDFLKFFSEEFGATLTVVSDIELAYRANFGAKEGVLIYAGTGSVAFTLGRDGAPMRTGGWGYLLGDEGAGYWIGREGIRAALLFLDGQVLPESHNVESAILSAMDAHDWSGVKSFVYGRDRSEIASLSKIVSEYASKGDETAISILKQASSHLTELVLRTEENTGRENQEVKFAGGISKIDLVVNEMKSKLGDRFSVATANIALEAARLAAHQ